MRGDSLLQVFKMIAESNNISNRILNSAKQLFFRYGYTKATTDEIAKEAGISKRTLYKYYPGKLQILESLIDIKLNYIHEQMNIITDSDMDFPDKLKSVMSIVAETLKEISREFLEDIRKSVPRVWKKIYNYRKELVEKYYTKILIEGKKSGHFKPEVNTCVAVLLMVNSMELIINPPEKGSLPEDLEHSIPMHSEELFDELLSLIYNGVLIKEQDIK